MNIIITLDCNVYNKGQFDISIDNDQVIKDCLDIVNEGLALNINIEEIDYCKSERANKLITVYSTFKESSVHTGDILKLL